MLYEVITFPGKRPPGGREKPVARLDEPVSRAAPHRVSEDLVAVGMRIGGVAVPVVVLARPAEGVGILGTQLQTGEGKDAGQEEPVQVREPVVPGEEDLV